MSALGNLVQEAKQAKGLFHQCCLKHTRRDGNTVAHAIAKNAFHSTLDNDCPQFLSTLVANDCYYLIQKWKLSSFQKKNKK